jgi:pimeloyl-ACP methyl ester carboxylesterase
MAERLAKRFTVFTYDRRGRGESGDTPPYAIDREVEDLAAVIGEAGGSAMVAGASSGAALALEGASRGLGITRLALYEAPFIVDGSRAPLPADFKARLSAAIAADRRSDAVAMFLKLVGVPSIGLAIMRLLPVWKVLTGVAHTLPYDITVVEPQQQGLPLSPARWSGASMKTLVVDGGKSPAYMRNGMRALADVLPNATYRTLPGQTHMINAKVLAPVVSEFFGASLS